MSLLGFERRAHLLGLLVLLGAPQSAQAITVDLTSGTTGTIHLNASFNETRGVTALVLSAVDLNLISMRLDGFSIGLGPSGTGTGGTVGARVYADVSRVLIASAEVAVPVGDRGLRHGAHDRFRRESPFTVTRSGASDSGTASGAAPRARDHP